MKLTPRTPEELAEALRTAAARKQTVGLDGNQTKRLMGGPIEPSDVTLTTTGLTRVLQYEPRDLTISVEAGLPWRELTRLVAGNGQMIPLDPAFAGGATVGGVIASNSSGPRRRLYGTARDVVIGMKFATLEGKLVQSGGMVVKNVAGLDMGKLMIGSMGTLAALAVINFKLIPTPQAERSFLLQFDTLEKAMAARDGVLRSVLQPAAIEVLNPAAAQSLDSPNWLLAFRVGGNQASIERYQKEFAKVTDWAVFEGEEQATLWSQIEDFTPAFLAEHNDGAVVRVSCTLKDMESLLASIDGAAVARAGSGVCYAHFAEAKAAARWMEGTASRGWKAVIEFCAEKRKHELDLWPATGNDFDVMRRVKQMFDPDGLLNRGRLYRRI
jgi:glycolate oxidase FAD binding subunit